MTTTPKPAPSADAVIDDQSQADGVAGRYLAAIRALNATIPAAEPVAWNCIFPTYGHFTLKKHEADQAALDGATVTPLYASPQPAREAAVKPLEWHKSHISSWNGDYHTVPTAYTVRCADENGWKWMGLGAHGYEPSPEAAMRAAQANHETYIRSALVAPQPARETEDLLSAATERLVAQRIVVGGPSDSELRKRGNAAMDSLRASAAALRARCQP